MDFRRPRTAPGLTPAPGPRPVGFGRRRLLVDAGKDPAWILGTGYGTGSAMSCAMTMNGSMREALKRPTINDIAKRAGLSKASVSRALNGKQDVDPETRRRVLEIADEVGYVPSASARALSNGRSNCRGLLVPSLTWPWILEVLRGVAEEIERSGYSLILYTTASGADAERAFMSQVVPAGAVDGLALVIPPGLLDHIGRLAKGGLPVVVIDDRGHHPEFPTVATTNVETSPRPDGPTDSQ